MEAVKDTLEIECLVQSLQEVIEARAEHDKARDARERDADICESAPIDEAFRLRDIILNQP